jgi:hypothetical protein
MKDQTTIEHWLRCVQTDDPELLIVGKVYDVVLFPTGDVGFTDEAGERAIYPGNYFEPVALPSGCVTADL